METHGSDLEQEGLLGTGRWLLVEVSVEMQFAATALTQRSGTVAQACSLCWEEKLGRSLESIDQRRKAG